MARDANGRSASTRRDYVKRGGALVGGGLLAGCAGERGPAPTGAGTSTEGASDRRRTAGTDSSHEVTVEPYGAIGFEGVPETYLAMGSGAWVDVGFAFRGEPAAMATSHYPFQYYDSLAGVTFDTGGVTDLGDVSSLDAEQFFEVGADAHVVDKQLLASYSGWDADDFERVETEVGPFAGSYVRGEWSGNGLGIDFSFPYYDLPEAIGLVGEVFQQPERARAWIALLDSVAEEIADRAPDSSPEVGVIYSGSDPDAGEFYIASPTAAGIGNYPYGVLDVSNGFAALTDDGTYQTDYEGLLEMDPEYICVDSAIAQLPAEEFESRFVERMREHPIGRALTAVRNDDVVRGCGRHQGPIIANFETEAMAKQLYPEVFGEWLGYEDGEAYPEIPADERLFDREEVADVVAGNATGSSG